MIGSAAGGMDIEEVAAHTPEQITTVNIHPAAGLQPYQCRRMAFALGFKGAQIAEFQKIAMALYQLTLDKDASLVEVNPLIVTKDGHLLALDAKTGEMKWMYAMSEGERATRWAPRQLSGRGLSYWTDGRGDERIFYVTTGYRLVSLNAKTGQPMAGFGTNGVISRTLTFWESVIRDLFDLVDKLRATKNNAEFFDSMRRG
jgi:hypothetical protein